ncbi:MAG: transcription termination factor Rho [Jatrophihabitantaceae bacterium]
MTDTQEQLPVATTAAGDGAGGDRTNGAVTPARAKRASLNTMLLSELQQLAGGMGISTAKLKKSDLVAAIKAAQAGGGAGAPARNGAAKTEAPPAQPDRPKADAAATDAPSEPGERAVRRPRERGQRNQHGEANNQTNQNAQGQGERSDRNQSGDRDRGNQGNNQNSNAGNQGGGPNNRDDDDESGRRRGRRYRDRRGRNRERGGNPQGGGGGNNDVEPTVSEDDVLIPVAGIVDEIPDKNTWFVRTGGYYASPEDVYVSNSYVRKFNLRRGDAVTGAIKQQREGERREKYTPLVRLDTVNGRPADDNRTRTEFTRLTPLYPQERLRLETEPHILTTRVIDLVMPIGKGQRALIVSPPKAGKTMVLQAIANAIATNNPEVHLMVVLIDERPEEVTDMQRSVKGEVIASTFDRRPQDHITVAELSIERAKRLVEMGHDVVVLLDSITRLGRAYNLGAPASGRILSGGVDSTALYPPKRFLGAARNIENGGSLTILATALVETGSAGDTVIFEEFKGTGNAELKLDRKIAYKRVFPAVDVDQSSTRKEEILLAPDELAVTIKLRRVLHALDSQQAIDLLLDRLRKTRTNTEFLMQIAKTTPGQD